MAGLDILRKRRWEWASLGRWQERPWGSALSEDGRQQTEGGMRGTAVGWPELASPVFSPKCAVSKELKKEAFS